MTKFILCIQDESGTTGKRLLKSIREQFPDIEIEHHNSVEDLQKRVCLPAYNKESEIVIVLVDNSERLERLIEIKGCLAGRRLVLALHEMSREILSRSLLLRPRYVSYGESQFSDLLCVLEKMINASCRFESAGINEKPKARETS